MHFHLKTILQTSADFTIIIFDIPNRLAQHNAYMALYFLRIIIYIEIRSWYNFSDCVILILTETTRNRKSDNELIRGLFSFTEILTVIYLCEYKRE